MTVRTSHPLLLSDRPATMQCLKNNHATVLLSGTILKLSYCSLEYAIALMKEQHAVETVEENNMRELTYYAACSVDGFIAHTDGSHDSFVV